MNSDHLAMKRGGRLIAELRMKSRGRHSLFYDCSLAQHKRRRYEKRIDWTNSLCFRVGDHPRVIASWLESRYQTRPVLRFARLSFRVSL